MINAQNILKSLNNKIEVYTYDVIPSTNDEATITYSEKGQERTAKIEGINDLGALLVIEGDEQKCLCSGEITITSIATDSR